MDLIQTEPAAALRDDSSGFGFGFWFGKISLRCRSIKTDQCSFLLHTWPLGQTGEGGHQQKRGSGVDRMLLRVSVGVVDVSSPVRTQKRESRSL